jgi:tetratricopeptide (TPR) repeat protein
VWWIAAVGYSGDPIFKERIAEIEAALKKLDATVRTKTYSLTPVIDSLRREADFLGDPRIRIMSNLALAKGYESQKDYERTYACVDRAFAIADSANFHDMDYMLNYRKGFILTLQGENDAALEYLQKAVEISAGKNHDASYGQAVAQLGYAYVKTGDFVQAIEHLDAASEILHRIGDEHGLQNLYTHMAVYYSRRGDREKALDQQKKALEASIARKDTIWIISSHVNLMSSYAILGDVEKAFYHYRERNRIIDLIEYPEDRKLDLNIGVLYVQSGQYAKALEILELCQQYYIKEGNTYRVALIDHWKALAYRGLDRYDLAAQKSLAAFDGARENDNKKLAPAQPGRD